MTSSEIPNLSAIFADNSPAPQKELDKVPNLARKLIGTTLKDLAAGEGGIFVYPRQDDKLPEDLKEKDFILKSENGEVWTTNVVGFLGLGEERLTIRSRFSSGERDYFFLYLLQKVLGLRIVNFDFGSTDDEIFSLLSLLFPLYLRRALSKGMYKEYIWREYNDSSLRGRLDVMRFVKKDIPFEGDVAYSRTEYSFDNRVTELIRSALERIAGQKEYSFLLEEAGEEAERVREATPSYSPLNTEGVITQNLRHPADNAFYDYRPLQKLSIDILQNRKSSWGNGTEEVYGVLFDCAWLWEEYVNLLIGEEFYHPKNKEGKGIQHMLYAADETAKKFSPIYPDFIRRRPPRTIADAKYKPVENIDPDDRLRMIGYLWRFDSMPGYFIFPEKEGEAKKDGLKWFKSEGFESKDFEDAKESSHERQGNLAMVACGVAIPQQAESYEVFSEKMAKAEREFKDRFLKRIANHGEC